MAESTGASPRVARLPPTKGDPRNSEGDFIQLGDGRLLFVYTHFTGGGGDHSRAHLAGRFSSDGGKTWQNVKTLENDPGGWNCYAAVEFVGPRVLLGHCAGRRATGGLNLTQITRFDFRWLYRR